jgi:hypothetical protein
MKDIFKWEEIGIFLMAQKFKSEEKGSGTLTFLDFVAS